MHWQSIESVLNLGYQYRVYVCAIRTPKRMRWQSVEIVLSLDLRKGSTYVDTCSYRSTRSAAAAALLNNTYIEW